MRTAFLAMILVAVSASIVHADPVPDKYKPMIEKGLAWLTKQQNVDGSWTTLGTQYPTSMTPLAGLALLAEGSTTSRGKYADHLRKAVDWLVKHSQKGNVQGGLIGTSLNPTETGRYMFGHTYGMLFLACVLAEEENRDRRIVLKDVLNRAVQFSVQAQTTNGGWYYTSARETGDTDEACVTVLQIQGLRAARAAGIPVPKATLRKSLDYLAQNTGPQGGLYYASKSKNERPALTAAAIACAYGPDHFDLPVVSKWIANCQKTIPLGAASRIGHDEFTHFYYAQVIHGLGEKGHGRLFPNSADKLQWSKYREKFFGDAQARQNNDGSWTGSGFSIGPVFATATTLLVLQLDNEAIPIISSRND